MLRAPYVLGVPVEFLTDEEAARYGCRGERRSRRAGGLAGLIMPAATGGEPAAVAPVRNVPGDPAPGGARGGFWDLPDGGYCCAECGEPFPPPGGRWSGEQLDWRAFV